MVTDSIAYPPLRVSRCYRKDNGWVFVAGGTEVFHTDAWVSALREYFTRPKALTPRERAIICARELHEAKILTYVQYHAEGLVEKLTAAIEDAARRGVDWTEE